MKGAERRAFKPHRVNLVSDRDEFGGKGNTDAHRGTLCPLQGADSGIDVGTFALRNGKRHEEGRCDFWPRPGEPERELHLSERVPHFAASAEFIGAAPDRLDEFDQGPRALGLKVERVEGATPFRFRRAGREVQNPFKRRGEGCALAVLALARTDTRGSVDRRFAGLADLRWFHVPDGRRLKQGPAREQELWDGTDALKWRRIFRSRWTNLGYGGR